MYPKRKPKSDRERFLEAFTKKVGAAPDVYVRRKLAAGVDEGQLRQMYDLLAVEIARRVHCTAIRYAELNTDAQSASARMIRRASQERIPRCARCGAQMVLRTAQKGARKGQRFWGCSRLATSAEYAAAFTPSASSSETSFAAASCCVR